MSRQFREAEGEEELADERRRPGPQEGRAARAITHVECLEEAGQDGDVREAGREGGEAAERAVEFLLVAERSEIAAVRVGHGLSPRRGSRDELATHCSRGKGTPQEGTVPASHPEA